MLLDGTQASDARLKNMLFYDVTNGIARRSWARNPGSMSAIQRIMEENPELKVTVPQLVEDELLDQLIS